MKKLIKKISLEHIFLGIVLLLLILLRLPSLIEPHWNSQEAIYAVASQGMLNGQKLYSEVFTPSMPGIIVVYYLVNLIAGLKSLAILKTVNLIASTLTIILIYKLGKEIFNKKVASLATFLSLPFLATPIIGANIASSAGFFLPMTLLGIYFYEIASFKYSKIIAGIFLALSALFHLGGIFFTFGLICYSAVTKSKKLAKFCLSVFVILLVFFLVLTLNGNCSSLMKFLGERIGQLQEIDRNELGFVIFPNTILIRSIVSGIILIIASNTYKKGKLDKKHFLLTILTIASMYSALLIEKPNVTQLLIMIPTFSLVLSIVALRLFLNEKNRQISLYIAGTLAVISISFLNLFSDGNALHSPIDITTYYYNAYRYALHKIDSSTYIETFGYDVFRNYRLNSLLSQQYPNTANFFIWTDLPWIYVISDNVPPAPYPCSASSSKNIGDLKNHIIINSPDLIIIDEKNSLNSKEFTEFIRANNYTFDIYFDGYNIYNKLHIEANSPK